MNYLRPSVKRGQISPDEEDLILRLHRLLGNRYTHIDPLRKKKYGQLVFFQYNLYLGFF
jgi:hypothetical protein